MMKQYNKKSVFVFLVVSVVCIGLLPSLNYFKNPDKTKAEDLFKTDILESYINYVLFKFFHKSTNPENVIVGKNGDLFLGNNHNKLLYKTIGVYSFSKQQRSEKQQWRNSQAQQGKPVVYPEHDQGDPDKSRDTAEN